jgi:hypothetical protein
VAISVYAPFPFRRDGDELGLITWAAVASEQVRAGFRVCHPTNRGPVR